MDSMKLMHNADLCDNLGNLVNRAVTLCNGSVPDIKKGTVGLPFDLKEMKKATTEAFAGFRLSEAADLAVNAAKATNKWIADLEPWKMKDESKQVLKASTLRVLVEAVYVLAHFFAPFLPTAAEAIFKKLNVAPTAIPDLSDDFMNLKTGAAVTSSSVLFQVLDTKASTAPAAVAVAKAAPVNQPPAAVDSGKEAKKPEGKEAKKVEAKAKSAPPKEKGKAQAAPEDSAEQPLFSKLDIRVGKVVEAEYHPEADRLFVEKIDVGDPEGPRTIVSGLREHYTLEQFTGKKLLAVCNMKPSKLVGVTSSGMVLCAKEGKVVELLAVPDSLEVGTRVLPEGMSSNYEPLKPETVKKKKVWESVAELLRTDANGVATFDGVPLSTPSGEKFTSKCANSQIS
jgi:methionine--tRNA ligase beta chain